MRGMPTAYARLTFATIRTALITGVLLAVFSCSKTATSRIDQEAEFKDLFGIAPPAAVVNIRYHEASGMGGYERWMSFTWDAATYDAVLKANGYKLSKFSMAGDGNTPSAPAWWPKKDPPQSVVYYRDQDETPEQEGFQFWEFMWHDASSGLVYFSKYYCD